MTTDPATSGSPTPPLDRVLRLCGRLTDGKLAWLRMYGIPLIQRDRRGIVVTLPKEKEEVA